MFNSKKKFDLSPRLKFGVGRGYSQNQLLKIGAGICLVVAIALTGNTIRLLFFSHSGDNFFTRSAPRVLGAIDIRVPDSPASVQFVEYKIQKGDTLFNISQQYKIDWTTLATINNIKSPFSVKPGQTIKIPK